MSLMWLCALLLRVPQIPAAADSPQMVGPELSGRILAERVELVAGKTWIVSGDVELESKTDILIRGDLIAHLRSPAEPRSDAPRIVLRASQVIHVTGSVLGADGQTGRNSGSAERSRGGHGSSILLDAPLIVIEGTVWSGDGAPGRAGEDGGFGGDLVLDGKCLGVRRPSGAVHIRTGNGGHAGAAVDLAAPAPMAGRGGNVVFQNHERIDASSVQQHRARLRIGVSTPAIETSKKAFRPNPCTNGTEGMDGLTGVMGTGGQGATGANGTSQSPQGGPGGNGGAGGVGGRGIPAGDSGSTGSSGGNQTAQQAPSGAHGNPLCPL